ncbi:GTPase, partial [Hungatella hathewayi]
TRNLELPGGEQILLTDTVGFIRKLPHNLIEAFKSTLEEAKYSDIILHVVDCSNPQMDMQMYVVYETLKDLGVHDKEVITVFNKIDAAGEMRIPRDLSSDYQVKISAKTGEGLDELLNLLESILRSRKVFLERVYPYQEAGKIQLIRKYGQLLKEEYRDDGIFVSAYVPAEMYTNLI